MKTFIVFAISLAFLSAFSIQLSSGISDRRALASKQTKTEQTPNVTPRHSVSIFTWLSSTISDWLFGGQDYDYTIDRTVRFLVVTNESSVERPISLGTFDNELQLSKTRKTVFLTHGFSDDRGSPLRVIEAKLLYDPQFKGEIQTVFVDWGLTAAGDFENAVSKLPGIGRAIAAFAKNQGLNVEENVHCIGHSLGSHVCGYFGKALQKDFGEKMARITGLDPAGPLFSLDAPRYRLDKSDAKWVDVIHTDIEYGNRYPIGHQDFFPNGGYIQPGCDEALCDHVIAIYFYESSFNCSFVAEYCTEDESNPTCTTNQFALMGYNNIGPNNPYENSPEGSYFLETKAEAPFCIQK